MKNNSEAEDLGWIKLHRRLLGNPRFQDPEWVSVWVYLLLRARHKAGNARFNGKPTLLKAGQLITGRHAIASATGVHESKVRRVLKTLESDQQIEIQPSSTHSIITILNWAPHQQTDQQTDQPPANDRPTTDQPAANDRPQTRMERKEEWKNGRMAESSGQFAERPAWEEVKFYAAQIGLAEWKARDWFDEMEGGGWLDHNHRPVQRWQSVLNRVKTKWEAEGRPSGPPAGKLLPRQQIRPAPGAAF